MLQCLDDRIVELPQTTFSAGNLGGYADTVTGGMVSGSYTYTPYTPTIWWNQYPVYVCTDKTAKAIEILKKLQAEKHLEVKSVPRFIELVEMIAGIL